MKAARLLVLLGLVPAASRAAPQRLTLGVDPPAEVRFLVEAPLDSVPGVSHAVSGWVLLDPGDLAGARASVAVDLASFDTGIELRNEDLRDQFLEVDRYKEAVLAVKGLEHASGPLAPGAEVRADALATFSLHGVTREIHVPVKLRLEGHGDRAALSVSGGFSISIAEYRMRRPNRLFLKVGEVVQIGFDGTFRAAPPSPPATSASTPAAPAGARAALEPSAAHRRPPLLLKRAVSFVPVAHLPSKAPRAREPAFRYPFDSAEGRGERMFHDASIGGAGNALACAACHSTADERWGLASDGKVRPNRTLHDSARRPSLWQGLARTVGEGATICAKLFMLKPSGLDRSQEVDLAVFLSKLSPDPAPALDYRKLALTRRSGLPDPLGGDPRRGQEQERRFCGACHGEGEIRPPLTPGLYEADDLVRRVRWLPGSDARQMPPIYVDRLPDSDLRDIVTWLAGDESQRIFKRRRR